MGRMTDLRDHALVAFLMARGHQVTANGEGGFLAEMSEVDFSAEFREYRLHWRPVLSKIEAVRRLLSSHCPRAADLVPTRLPKS
jgi:hypothetical protein